MMRERKDAVVSLKKLKKGGGIDRDLLAHIVELLGMNEVVAIPVDNVYGFITCDSDSGASRLMKVAGGDETGIIQIISSFKMLEEIALIDKMRFDFLHRIWPGDVIVKLSKKSFSLAARETILVMSPKHKYVKDIADAVEKPILFMKGFENGRFFKNRDKKMVGRYHDATCLVVIIDELCKDHPLPTIVDLTGEELEIIYEGKVSSDEIKSLYFLDKM